MANSFLLTGSGSFLLINGSGGKLIVAGTSSAFGAQPTGASKRKRQQADNTEAEEEALITKFLAQFMDGL